MSRDVFGWDFPAGAANDPNAPYNQDSDPETCPTCDGPNFDEDGDRELDSISFPFCSAKCESQYEPETYDPEDC